MIQDKVSVVTVVYNAVSIIEETIKSVLSQTYTNIEYIVIDGGSTDGTVELIKKYEDQLYIFVSEPDKGIYDAMNKGIDKATGNWINFMNAGDHFYSPDAVSEIFDVQEDYSNYATVYGDAEYRLKSFSYIRQGYECDRDHFMPFSHQAAFARVDVAKKNKFNLKYKIAADTEFFLRLNREGYVLKHVSVIVCSYDASVGISMNSEVKHAKEFVDMQIAYGAPKDSSYFKKYIRNAYLRQYMRRLIPHFIWERMRENKIKKQTDITIKEI
ncbi:glycosyltransferase involved in cell wall biosynthesis [Dysgonomonas alginatilytica]|uniref:Glycosyltransferase involved in cell wall biosynthesis n=1 Tax=Dysgonomonas alginatilytica TaxID=1605892 RepID=A0A2V3PJH4_9BACT|nr:glycosyltransferase family 2 protein [Dysgonomonas alginatilytica]PXV60965.1 glycosyltransferase involved in cell wall biosynthesis [Dysgonomonas alginatilytica]